ncbi:hypothetical protein S7711_07158 [Stachybotrys chartarum IBT 7711]|uniref:Uncharacterized protein n=1 Tax=Stachybotrys chartarum (strain CBS 109288 / IBT 7711) TaxID=1280523 RepID=A0A084BAH6_STACB|nr:hypothetical protein S7711_07158 [Stachybotrys chartarum IBT 7711]
MPAISFTAETEDHGDGGEPIAIVGMGCRWSGGIRDAQGLWELLKNGRTGYRDFGDHRFTKNGFFHGNTDRPGSVPTRGGFLLTEDPRLFDPAFFSITPLEAETMDPSQRKLLEVVYEAFENAGETWESVAGSDTGVFVGNFSTDHIQIISRDPDNPRPYASTGSSLSGLSNRINYIFNLVGPSVTIDTACSSSMYALHLAITAIRNGDCSSAIVAASNCIIDPATQLMMAKLGVLSGTSTCHTFDAAADGYARGEGFAALYLKKISEVVDLDLGMPIRAVIRGTAINANGRTAGITHPSREGQEAVILKAYENAGGLSLKDTAYFECHGTGTPVGDPIEVSAISNVFSSETSAQDPLLLGSVKTNLGHTESASAIASIMKVVLALEHGLIPPTVGVTKTNPNIDLARSHAMVVQHPLAWPPGKLRRASINSFGYGGANGHCIIDHVMNVLPDYMKPGVWRTSSTVTIDGMGGHNGHQNNHSDSLHSEERFANLLHITREMPYANRICSGDDSQAPGAHMSNTDVRITPTHRPDNTKDLCRPLPTHYPLGAAIGVTRKAHASTRQLVVLPFSAHNAASLELNLSSLLGRIKRQTLADTAYTLAKKRTIFTHKTFRIVDRDNIQQALGQGGEQVVASTSRFARVGYVFTGQGAQWPAMGAQLLQYHVFSSTMRYLDHILQALPNGPSWRIGDVISGKGQTGNMDLPEFSQTATTAVQIGLTDLLASWGLQPSAVVGHSSGEIAAVYAAGRITAAEAIVTAYFRGQAVSKSILRGAMLAVGLGLEAVQTYISEFPDHVKVAAINSPDSVTLSGDVDAIEKISVALNSNNIFSRLLRTGGKSYHSHHMLALGQSYEEALCQGLDHINSYGLNHSRCKYPEIPWTSSVFPKVVASGFKVTPRYWRSNLECPVLFQDAVRGLIDSEEVPVDALVEIGPHPALKGPVSQTMQSVGMVKPYLPTLQRKVDGQLSILRLAGALFCLNASIDLSLVNSVDETGLDGKGLNFIHGCTTPDLPPYMMAYGPIQYHESRLSREFRSRAIIGHDLAGSKLPGNSKFRPQWRNLLRLKDVPWLADHCLASHVVFPAAGYVAIAVEVASRLHNESADALPITSISLRNISIDTPLRIPDDDYGVEVITTLEPEGSILGTAPPWASFTISSVFRDSSTWTMHCSGFVKVHVDKFSSGRNKLFDGMDFRIVKTRAWYKRFAEIGLNYGPAFQGMTEIRADPNRGLAMGTIRLETTKGMMRYGESRYHLHPASLDAMLQLGLVACHGGQPETARVAFVPQHIDELYIKAGNTEPLGSALAAGERRGLRGAYARLQLLDKTGDVVVDMHELRCVAYTEDTASESRPDSLSAPIMRLCWKPDIRTVRNAQAAKLFPVPPENVQRSPLFDVFERLGYMIVAEIHDMYADRPELSGASENIAYFLSWIRRRLEDKICWAQEARDLPSCERLRIIDQLFQETERYSDARAARHLLNNIEDILYERRSGLEVMIPNGLLASLYEDGIVMTGSYSQLSNLFESLGFLDPNLNIIEVGGGTGGATRVIMKALSEANGIKRYSRYTFTDISSGFLAAASETLSGCKDVKFAVLDIEQDPFSHGFQPIYDVVVASECLHATSRISVSLKNCRKLLKPGGKLVMVENIRAVIGHGLLLGTLPGYWNGIPDGRVDSPFVDLNKWNKLLIEAGFSGVDVALDDYPAPYTTACTIVSTAASGDRIDSTMSDAVSGRVYLVAAAEQRELLNNLADEFRRRQIDFDIVDMSSIGAIPSGSHTFVFMGDGNLLVDVADFYFEAIQDLVKKSHSLICITESGIVQGKNPDAGVAAGLIRTVGTESPATKFLFIDVDPDADAADHSLLDALIELEAGLQNQTPESHEDGEFSWQNGCLWVSRIVPDYQLGRYHEKMRYIPSYTEPLLVHGHGAVQAAFKTPGILTSLYFAPNEDIWKPLPNDWIQVKVAAAGLNWKDVARCSGRYDDSNFSTEFSGTIDRVGSAVANLSCGDRVFGYCRGRFGNFVRLPAKFCQLLQPGEDMVQAAAVPLVSMTAVYAFEYLTHLRRGQKLLVQSATGGLGLVAIQLARLEGAEIFAMAGTREKVEYLVNRVGLAGDHVCLQYDASAVAELLSVAGGKGFDIILGTAKGERLHETVKLVAPLGVYIDVGRVNVQNSMTMGLELFRKGATFSSFDLNEAVDVHDPELGHALMESAAEHYRAGHIGPIPVISADISQLDQLLLRFSKGTHIGKFVVTYQDPTAVVNMVPSIPRLTLDDMASSYLVTGGLSGLGAGIVRWLARRGARHITVLSRRGPTAPGAQNLMRQLSSEGIQVDAIRCDVSNVNEVRCVVASISQRSTLKGIIHAAVSYQDLSFDKLTVKNWRAGLAAKVQGTKSLHEATKMLQLDFFVMTTSVQSVLALATQSAYIAANNFQEIFARYRRNLGMPASTVSVGLVSDVGSLSVSATTLAAMARNRALGLTESEFLQLLEIACLNNDVASDGASARMSSDDALSGAGIIGCLDPRAMAEAKQEAASAVRNGKEDGRTVADYGIDSLVAAELRNWLFKSFGVDISMLELMDARIKMQELAQLIINRTLESNV